MCLDKKKKSVDMCKTVRRHTVSKLVLTINYSEYDAIHLYSYFRLASAADGINQH